MVIALRTGPSTALTRNQTSFRREEEEEGEEANENDESVKKKKEICWCPAKKSQLGHVLVFGWTKNR